MKNKIIKLFGGILLGFAVVVTTGFFAARAFFYDIPVLMYHYVDYTESGSSLFVSPESFARQIDFISRRGYRVLTLDEYTGYIKEGRDKGRKNLVLLTFDDGREDNYTNAYPMLKEKGMSAVFFVPAGLIGEKDVLNREQITEMSLSGMEFGSHSLTHSYLPALSYEELEREIIESKKILDELLGEEIRPIAYPIGGYNEDTLELVRAAGYSIAFTTNRGFSKNRRNDDYFAVRRVKIKDSDSSFNLWLKLSGIYNLFKSVKEPY